MWCAYAKKETNEMHRYQYMDPYTDNIHGLSPSCYNYGSPRVKFDDQIDTYLCFKNTLVPA